MIISDSKELNIEFYLINRISLEPIPQIFYFALNVGQTFIRISLIFIIVFLFIFDIIFFYLRLFCFVLILSVNVETWLSYRLYWFELWFLWYLLITHNLWSLRFEYELLCLCFFKFCKRIECPNKSFGDACFKDNKIEFVIRSLLETRNVNTNATLVLQVCK